MPSQPIGKPRVMFYFVKPTGTAWLLRVINLALSDALDYAHCGARETQA
jgi:hypothetical protein